MKIRGKLEWVKINDNAYLCICIDIEKIKEKDIPRFARKNYNVAVAEVTHKMSCEYSYKIFEVSSHPSIKISNECLNGIEDYIFELV